MKSERVDFFVSADEEIYQTAMWTSNELQHRCNFGSTI